MSTTEPVGPAGPRSGSTMSGGTMSGGTVSVRGGSVVDPWAAAHSSLEFATLRTRLRRFVFPMTAFFLAWYFAYVLLAAFAPHFMSIRVVGNINVGLVFGLLQFVSTFAITTLYVRFADRHLDPIGNRIREQIEGGAW